MKIYLVGIEVDREEYIRAYYLVDDCGNKKVVGSNDIENLLESRKVVNLNKSDLRKKLVRGSKLERYVVGDGANKITVMGSILGGFRVFTPRGGVENISHIELNYRISKLGATNVRLTEYEHYQYIEDLDGKIEGINDGRVGNFNDGEVLICFINAGNILKLNMLCIIADTKLSMTHAITYENFIEKVKMGHIINARYKDGKLSANCGELDDYVYRKQVIEKNVVVDRGNNVKNHYYGGPQHKRVKVKSNVPDIIVSIIGRADWSDKIYVGLLYSNGNAQLVMGNDYDFESLQRRVNKGAVLNYRFENIRGEEYKLKTDRGLPRINEGILRAKYCYNLKEYISG